MRLLDPRFHYVPAAKTDVLSTWRRFGYRPTSDAERRARLREPASVATTAPLRSDIDLRSKSSPREKGLRSGLKLVAD
jgi:hypothetical protein